MTTDIVNAHRFATTSTAGSCRNNCGWCWTEKDMMDTNDRVYDDCYSIEFEPPYFGVPPLCPNEVENRETFLVVIEPQATAELLQENCQAFRRTKKQDRVDFRDVDPFIVEIHDKDKIDGTGAQSALNRLSHFVW